MTTPEDLYATIDRLVEQHAPALIALRRRVHEHPELSGREVRTAQVVADQLRAIGFDEVRIGVGGHGVVGVLRGGRPGDRVIALRADMDGLPVREASGEAFASQVVDAEYPGGPFPVAHACGHDCHVAAVLTTASVLGAMRADLPGTVVCIFQSAEEGPPIGETDGARAMLDSGALDDPRPTMAFGLHVGPFPTGTVAYHVGEAYAGSALVRIRVEGVQTHGSTPWLGADPMPAVGQIISGVGQLYRQVPADHRVSATIGHIEDVGRFNIIPGHVTLYGTLRAATDADMDDLQAGFRRLAEGSAEAFGCRATVDFLQRVPPVRNTQAWMDAAMPTLQRVVGARHVVEAPPLMGYDDVSLFVEAFGGLYLNLGVQDTRLDPVRVLAPIEGGRGLVQNHHPGFYANEAALPVSVRIHANIAVDHLLGLIEVSPPAG
ncbi:MAG: amidohydrolase [Chloroflexi bacterium]|nr:amidohydrolase [Chloroflexota bacterium]